MPSIITQNVYLEKSLDCILRIIEHRENVIIIDVDMQLTLRKLISLLDELSVDSKTKVIFTGTPSIYISFFKKFDWMDVGLPLDIFVERLRISRGIKVKALKDAIECYLSLGVLSISQSKIAFLSMHYEVGTIAKILSATEKNIYTMINIIEHKMNFNSLNHLRYFMIREYGGFY
ncbi:hypothetical protein U0Y97_10320 [Enterobacter chuandaensis]|uniref:hypothetical protein n=1 Tax=Enterobacter chuandaensis TaxID=2497875 RepID=UPI0039C0DB81